MILPLKFLFMNNTTNNLNLAGIDIGSNAARLLIKRLHYDADGSAHLSKVLFLRIPIRLGMDVFTLGKITDGKVDKFLRTIKVFRQLMKIYEVADYRAYATAALRNAENGKKILKRIMDKTGIKIDIISGHEEAQIIYDNHVEKLITPGNYLYMDVGGGSTEISLIHNRECLISNSYDVGTLRMLNDNVSPETLDTMQQDLQRLAGEYKDITLIGSGGNINKLFRIATRKSKCKNQLSVNILQKLYAHLSELSIEQRIESYDLKPDRADVIVPAAELFLSVAECVGAENIIVPTIGLADGILNLLANTYDKQK